MIKDIIKKHFDGWSDYTELHEVLDDGVIERICQEMCELQKQECLNHIHNSDSLGDTVYYFKNVKNVCT